MKRVLLVLGTALVIISALAGGIALLNNTGSQEAATNVAQPTTTQSATSIPQDAYVIDVRTTEEYAEGHAKIAKHLALQDIENGKLPEVSKEQKIYVYCRSGNRSAQASSLLRQAGYTSVEDLGGVAEAREAGLEFTN